MCTSFTAPANCLQRLLWENLVVAEDGALTESYLPSIAANKAIEIAKVTKIVLPKQDAYCVSADMIRLPR
jgi:hypothetical protein